MQRGISDMPTPAVLVVALSCFPDRGLRHRGPNPNPGEGTAQHSQTGRGERQGQSWTRDPFEGFCLECLGDLLWRGWLAGWRLPVP